MTDSDNIALGQPTVGEEELEAIAEVFRSGWLAGQGPTGRLFEAEFAAAVASRDDRKCRQLHRCLLR